MGRCRNSKNQIDDLDAIIFSSINHLAAAMQTSGYKVYFFKNIIQNMEKDMNNFMKAIDTLTAVINGSDHRKGTDRRKNKQRKRKNERRIAQRRK